MCEAEARFVGLDLHRHGVMVGAVNAHQDIVLTPQRVTLRRFAAWVSRHLRLRAIQSALESQPSFVPDIQASLTSPENQDTVP